MRQSAFEKAAGTVIICYICGPSATAALCGFAICGPNLFVIFGPEQTRILRIVDSGMNQRICGFAKKKFACPLLEISQD
jgi:hypothetical protein